MIQQSCYIRLLDHRHSKNENGWLRIFDSNISRWSWRNITTLRLLMASKWTGKYIVKSAGKTGVSQFLSMAWSGCASRFPASFSNFQSLRLEGWRWRSGNFSLSQYKRPLLKSSCNKLINKNQKMTWTMNSACCLIDHILSCVVSLINRTWNLNYFPQAVGFIVCSEDIVEIWIMIVSRYYGTVFMIECYSRAYLIEWWDRKPMRIQIKNKEMIESRLLKFRIWLVERMERLFQTKQEEKQSRTNVIFERSI